MFHPLLIAVLSLGQAAAKPDENGFLTHTLQSEFQAGPTEIKVLLPDKLDKDRDYRVLYVLPVEPSLGQRWGHGLLEVKKLDLHNKHGLICVLPTFSTWPWYADHPTDPRIRQESYLLKEVLPLVEQNYRVNTEPSGQLLLGFSKSGNGAMTLLLRHPGVFGKVALFDSPLTLDQPNRFGSVEVYGTAQHFEQYRIPKLLAERGKELGKEKRIALVGHASFTDQHRAAHQQLEQLHIAHLFVDEKLPKHSWDAGWIGPAVEFLVK